MLEKIIHLFGTEERYSVFAWIPICKFCYDCSNLNSSEPLKEALLQQYREGRIVAAICAAPMVLGGLGLLKGRNATCYPGFEPKLIGANVTGEAVEISDNVITGKGPGLVMNFGLALVAAIKNDAVAEEVAAGLLL